MSMNPPLRARSLPVLLLLVLSVPALAQAPATTPDSAAQSAEKTAQKVGATTKETGQTPSSAPTDTQQVDEDNSTALGKPLDLPATAPAPAPPNNNGRPRIGLALGGGGALGLTEIGALEWFEEHHIPVDVIAGTSMGCMVSALYSTGKTPAQLKTIMNDTVFNSVFSFNPSYKSRNFRRREDSRELPNAITIGLRHGVSFRNSVLTDQGLNAFLDRQFLRYDDRIEFNDLPIPLRCLSTDLNIAHTVTFARGSLPSAVRASISIPGVFQPVAIDGHQFVDGAVLENLPTQTVHDMKADVVIAFSLPLGKLNDSSLNSLFGVLGRSFGVAIEGNERQSRRLADVVITPNVDGFGQTDYLKGVALAQRGYDATEKHKAQLLKYAISDEQWQVYMAQRASRRPHAAGNVLRVRINAPNDSVTKAVQRKFDPLVGKPIDTDQIDELLGQIRSGGQYDADYSVGYDENATAADADRPIILVTVLNKAIGPPFLARRRQRPGSDLRRHPRHTRIHFCLAGSRRLRLRAARPHHRRLSHPAGCRVLPPLPATGTTGGFFVAPNGSFLRNPFYIYANQQQISERLLQNTSGGADIGWSDAHIQEVRVGWSASNVRWTTYVGSDTLSPPSSRRECAVRPLPLCL